jgi:hypothetical protein
VKNHLMFGMLILAVNIPPQSPQAHSGLTGGDSDFPSSDGTDYA